MSRITSEKRWVVLREYLGTLSEAGLRSVCDAKHWCSGRTVDNDGARCFVGHAGDYRRLRSGVVQAQIPAPVSGISAADAAEAFDELALGYGLQTAVRSVKRLAAATLKARKGKPLEVAL